MKKLTALRPRSHSFERTGASFLGSTAYHSAGSTTFGGTADAV